MATSNHLALTKDFTTIAESVGGACRKAWQQWCDNSKKSVKNNVKELTNNSCIVFMKGMA
jgi:hypothetical protein